MSNLVSILLPAYNCDRYIAQTIESILLQTYTHFELLIINDGSTDNTIQEIEKFKDKRIQLIHNPQNMGLIATLNKGLQIAKGRFIARIDADDICLPNRIEKQVNFLLQHPNVAVVATQIQFINQYNEVTGDWPLDKKTNTHLQIKKAMIWQSCIAHPTVMFNTQHIKNYTYHYSQVHSEDYDLWLTLLADGKIFEKIAEPLLLYRVHQLSITGSIHKKNNPYFTLAKTKKQFLKNRCTIKKWGLFETQLLFVMLHDFVMGTLKQLKEKLSF